MHRAQIEEMKLFRRSPEPREDSCSRADAVNPPAAAVAVPKYTKVTSFAAFGTRFATDKTNFPRHAVEQIAEEYSYLIEKEERWSEKQTKRWPELPSSLDL